MALLMLNVYSPQFRYHLARHITWPTQGLNIYAPTQLTTSSAQPIQPVDAVCVSMCPHVLVDSGNTQYDVTTTGQAGETSFTNPIQQVSQSTDIVNTNEHCLNASNSWADQVENEKLDATISVQNGVEPGWEIAGPKHKQPIPRRKPELTPRASQRLPRPPHRLDL